MGHTNSTANLGLPQFIGTDKPTWLSDVNGAFAAIDTYAGNNDAALAITDAKADTAVNDAASAVTTATNAANTAGTASTQATNAVTVAGNALTVANGINSKVGVLTDLTTTDKSTVVNAINEVNGKDAGDIAYDNTGSGLTATDVQAAIDEIAQGGGGGGTSFTKIWDNPDPTQTFAAQPITLTSDNYDLLLWIFGGGSADSPKSTIVPKGSKVLLDAALTNASTGTTNIERSGTYLTDTSYSISDGSLGRPGTAATTDNTVCKPLAVYGIKF